MSAPAAKRFWWVNQNQTFEQEFRGGYLWSPKTNANGARNQFYENMRMVAPGDVVFSFRDTRIAALGVAQSYAYESPKPPEFGSSGLNWNQIGWRVDVQYVEPARLIRPREHMDVLRPLLPEKYSPLRTTGDGLQSVYLAELSATFAEVLAGLVGLDAQGMVSAATDRALLTEASEKVVGEWEEHLVEDLRQNRTLDDTEKTSLVKSRRGQGIFKENVMKIEKACRITGVENPAHLIGSHIKPWRHSDNAERLDGENGLLLTPSIDHLFDRGFISFQASGELVVSPRADRRSLGRMGVRVGEGLNVGAFTRAQEGYLEYHRDLVFLSARSK